MWEQAKPILVLVLLLTDGLPTRYGFYRGTNGQSFEENISSKWQQLCPYRQQCSPTGAGPALPPRRGPCCSSCKCTENCLLYGTCCPDSPFFRQIKQDYPFRCVDTYMKTTGSQSMPLLMVSVCSESGSSWIGVDPSYISKCNTPNREVLKENTPVSSQNSPYVYRNVYCALCHGETNVTYWKATVWNAVSPLSSNYRHTAKDVNSTYLQAIDYNNTDINIFFNKPYHVPYPPLCFLASVRQCNVTGRWNGSDHSIEKACTAFLDPYVPSASQKAGFSYNNVFCAVCNGVELEAMCSSPTVSPVPAAGFLALINFQEEVSPSVTVINEASSTDNTCTEETFFDPYQNDCRPWFCPKGFNMDNGECQSVWQVSYGFTFFILVKAIPLVDIELSAFDLRDIGIVLETDMFACQADVPPGISLGQISSPFQSDHRRTPYFVFLFRYSLFNFEPGIYIMKSHLNCVGSFNTSSADNQTMFRYEHADNIAIHRDRNPKQNKYFPTPVILADEDDSVLNNHFISTSYSVPMDPIVRASRFLFCTQVLLEKGQYEFQDKKLFLPSQRLTLYPDVYDRDGNGGVRICLEDYLRDSNQIQRKEQKLSVVYTASTALFVVYAVIAIMSLVSALIALKWFSRISKPFRIACIVFVCHLLLAQILTIFPQTFHSEGYTDLCRGLGVSIHVTWLATASLNTMFGSPLFLTQSSEYSESSRVAHIRMVVFDSLLCYLPSIVLPAIFTGLSLYSSSDQRFGYGTRYCFIDSTQMFGYFFVLPLALSLLVSGVMCCWSRMTSKAPVVQDESGSTSLVWPSVAVAIILNLASCGWFMVYLLHNDSFWHLFWICDVILCVFALYSFAVKPILNARRGSS